MDVKVKYSVFNGNFKLDMNIALHNVTGESESELESNIISRIAEIEKTNSTNIKLLKVLPV
ncbi:hypothetical protein D3C87_1260270 [compost metagenome]